MDYKISEELKQEFLHNYNNYGDYDALKVLKKERDYFSEKQEVLYHCVMLLNEVLACYEHDIENYGIEFDYDIYWKNKMKLLDSLGIDLEV